VIAVLVLVVVAVFAVAAIDEARTDPDCDHPEAASIG
jgi:hypothetical protein